MIVIVGAGLAGLTCARVLHRARHHFLLLEREETVGGRVRTEVTGEGYRLDRGFQALFTRYPAVRRHLDVGRLGGQALTPGAVIVGEDGVQHDLDDPLRVPARAWRTLRSPVLSLADKGRVALEVADLRLRTAEGIWTDRDSTTHAYLHERGFSEQAIEQFFRPFFGGIFLDRSLSTSSNVFRFVFKMMAEGDIVVPALGIGEIAKQLASTLPPDSVRTGVQVDALVRGAQGVSGVRAGGEEIAAEAVIVATEAGAAAALTREALPGAGLGVTTLYFVGAAPLLASKKIWLNSAPAAYINEAVQLTEIAPEYAPPSGHLLSVTVLGTAEADDDLVERKVREELSAWYGPTAVAMQRLVALQRIGFAQFAQPAGFAVSLPPTRTGTRGLYFGGEFTRSSSINGAMEAGEAAAQAVVDDLEALRQ